jgi:polar amino acid transport system substrate-binding protein
MFLLITNVSFSSGFARDTVHVSTGEYPSGYSEYSPHYGFNLHIVTEAFALVDIQVIYHFFPWGRAFEQSKTGELSATCCWYPHKSRTKYFYLSDTVFAERISLFHLKDYKFDWDTVADLKRIRIGATIGVSLGEELNAQEKTGGFMIQRVPNDVFSFKKLLIGRVDVVPVDNIIGYELIRSNFSSEEMALFTHHKKSLFSATIHLAFPKSTEERSKRLLSLFNQGLKLLKENGQYDKIIENAVAGKYNKMQEKWTP